MTVHQVNCARALDTDAERKIRVSWNPNRLTGIKRAIKIRILSLDSPGLLAMLSQTITGCSVNIASANIRTTKEKKAIALFEVEVSSMEQLERVLSALEAKKGVISVERS